jgi:hypothetical protein
LYQGVLRVAEKGVEWASAIKDAQGYHQRVG